MNQVALTTKEFAPVVLGFFGLATGYLIWGVQEVFGYPPRDESVDRATGQWAIWMSGFCQFVTGTYLFAALVLFGSLSAAPLYMAAVAFSAYGIHWFALGWNRYRGNDSRADGIMGIPFIVLGILGAWVFFAAHAWPVGVLFVGLTFVYLPKPFLDLGGGTTPNRGALRAMGTARILTGCWLLYLVVSTTLDITLHYKWPGG